MFDKAIIDTDKFMDMPLSSKAIYFLLGMEADDEGFVSYKKVMRIHGGNEDDIKVLLAKKLIIIFESKVVVITDWRKNNWLDTRRIKPTEYQIEKELLTINSDNSYSLSKCLASAKRVEKSGEENREEESSIISYTEKDKFLTDLLYKLVKQNYPFLKEKDYSKDYAEMNKLNRIDKWEYRQIEFIIKWSQQDEFWKQNIRSVKKLRKQFENLIVRAKENSQNKINITI